MRNAECVVDVKMYHPDPPCGKEGLSLIAWSCGPFQNHLRCRQESSLPRSCPFVGDSKTVTDWHRNFFKKHCHLAILVHGEHSDEPFQFQSSLRCWLRLLAHIIARFLPWSILCFPLPLQVLTPRTLSDKHPKYKIGFPENPKCNKMERWELFPLCNSLLHVTKLHFHPEINSFHWQKLAGNDLVPDTALWWHCSVI